MLTHSYVHGHVWRVNVVYCSSGHLLPGPSNEVVIELSVRPLLESGVVMVLTEPVSSRLVLAVGLVRGVVSGGML